jgi:hypothetical protein
VTQEEWTVSRERLARMREELPARPYAQRMQLEIVDPRSGEVHRVHGAVAVSPGRAARLVLAGASGAPAVDAWVTRERFYVSIPSIKLVRRGADLVDAPPLPIGLLRWWFVAPLEGRLPGTRGEYIDGEGGLRVLVLLEDLLDEEPDPATFMDPDEKSTTL